MGRPPCCDKDGIKKGPWTPEEDIILVSYIQQHGPGNWRSVPTNTGLQRCSKSCRLRWTNYLRPGIKRGNFTPHEEGMIIHLQALLGNKWAAIASYLPQRTDNDIKNYWNTHLKKKLKRFQSTFQQDQQPQVPLATTTSSSSPHSKPIYDENYHHNVVVTPPHHHQPTSSSSSSSSTCYASSTENISRLLESWMKCSTPITHSKPPNFMFGTNNDDDNNHHNNHNNDDMMAHDHHECGLGEEDEHFETMLSYNNLNHHNVAGITTTATTTTTTTMTTTIIACNSSKEDVVINNGGEDEDDDDENNPPLTFLEKWLLDESTMSRHVIADEILRLPSIF